MRRLLLALTCPRSRARGLAPAASARLPRCEASCGDRDHLRRQRPRLGARRRHEPVRRAGLRQRRLDVRPDPRPLLCRRRARPGAGSPCPGARRRGEGGREVALHGAVPRARRLREDLSAAGRRGAAGLGPKLLGDRQRDADRARRADPLPPRHARRSSSTGPIAARSRSRSRARSSTRSTSSASSSTSRASSRRRCRAPGRTRP